MREDVVLPIMAMVTIAIGFFVGYWIAINDLRQEYESKVVIREIVYPKYDLEKRACVG